MPKRKLTLEKQKEKNLRKGAVKVQKIPIPQPEKAVKRFERGLQDVLRALKKAKSFDRQRLSKRIITDTKAAGKLKKRQAKRKNDDTIASEAASNGTNGRDPNAAAQKLERLQREMQVLKILDLDVAARVHLANSMLRVKDIAEAPGPISAHLKAIAELPASKNQRGDAADVHNVTSALYNRANVRETVSKAVTGVCLLLCVPIPERYQRQEWTKEERMNIKSGKADSDEEDMEIIDGESETESVSEDGNDDDDDDDDDDSDSVSTKEEGKDGESKKQGGEVGGHDEAESDMDAEERALARFEARLGGSSEDEDSEDEDLETLRAKYKKALAEGPAEAEEGEDDDDEEEDEEEELEGEEDDAFYLDENPSREIGVASSDSASDEDTGDEDDVSGESGESDSNSDSDSDEPPRKRRATAVSAKGRATATAADSRFLPTLMGGYVSDGGGSSDDGRREDDDAAATRMLTQRKNRRGQRARQAIWEKKYKEQARHVKAGEQGKKSTGSSSSSKTGWDAKRGAVGADDGPRWLRRKLGKQLGAIGTAARRPATAGPAKESSSSSGKKKSKDDDGPLHPSWEAAKKAKEKAQTAEFTGKKIVFD